MAPCSNTIALAEGNEKMPSEPVTDADVKKLDELIDRYGIAS